MYLIRRLIVIHSKVMDSLIGREENKRSPRFHSLALVSLSVKNFATWDSIYFILSWQSLPFDFGVIGILVDSVWFPFFLRSFSLCICHSSASLGLFLLRLSLLIYPSVMKMVSDLWAGLSCHLSWSFYNVRLPLILSCLFSG